MHATPYTPEGKGKIERFFGSLRKRFLPLLEEPLSLEELNAALSSWIDSDYHHRVHASIGQTPLERYLAHLSLLRPAPKDLSTSGPRRRSRTISPSSACCNRKAFWPCPVSDSAAAAI